MLAEATADPPLENHMEGSNVVEISARNNNDLDDVPNNENINNNNINRNEELENQEGAVAAGVVAGLEQN